MDLMHREWGYILYTNLSVQSTFLEGFTANGSLSYASPSLLSRHSLITLALLSSVLPAIGATAGTTTTPPTPRTHTAGPQARPPR